MLIALTVLKSLDFICEYAILLSKRIGHRKNLFVLLVNEEETSQTRLDVENQKLSEIEKLGEQSNIEIRHRVVNGDFPDEVANAMFELNCPLLLVGEGHDRMKRLEELKKIENLLVARKGWFHRHNHHFMMVSRRQPDPVLVVLNQKNGDLKGKKK